MIDLLSFIGGMALAACALVGAYVWLRWGFAGVQVIWAKRQDLDEKVRWKVLGTRIGGLR